VSYGGSTYGGATYGAGEYIIIEVPGLGFVSKTLDIDFISEAMKLEFQSK